MPKILLSLSGNKPGMIIDKVDVEVESEYSNNISVERSGSIKKLAKSKKL